MCLLNRPAESRIILPAVVYIATVPLHILHKHMASMLLEAFTLAVLAYGSWSVFVA